MRNRTTVLIVGLGVALAALSARPARAMNAESLPADVKAVFDKMTDAYKSADTYRDEGRIEIRMNADDPARAHVMPLPILFERPNKIRMMVDAVYINSDGSDLYRYSQLFKRYTRLPSPSSLDSEALFGRSASRGTDLFVQLWLLLEQDPIDKLLANAESVDMAGEEDVDGHTCQVVAVNNRPGYLDGLLFVDRESGLLREYRMEADAETKQMRPGAPQWLALKFKDSKINEPFEDDTFAFAPPADAQEVDDLAHPNATKAQAVDAESNDAPMKDKDGDASQLAQKPKAEQPAKPQTAQRPVFALGQPAPDWELSTLSGEKLKLSDLRGQVVVLDFWAAWCGPCVRGLPYVERMSKSFDGKPVRVIGVCVDRRSDMNKINDTLRRTGVTFTNVIDRSGRLSMLYQARSIPMTVLVDQEGVVRKISRGFSPREYQTIAAEINKQLGE